jgi:hypothetical protein
MKVALGVVVLGEDEDPCLIPFRRWSEGLRLSKRGQTGTHILSDPVNEPAYPRIGKATCGLGDLGHLIQVLLLAGGSAGVSGRGVQRSCLDLGFFLGLKFLLGESGSVVVVVDPCGEERRLAGVMTGACPTLSIRIQLALNRAAVHA